MEVKFLIACLGFLELCFSFAATQDEPFVDTSYGAVGEITIQYESGDAVMMMFEENFDFDNRKAVFTAHSAGFHTTLLEDMYLNQTFKYDRVLRDETYVESCKIYDPTEWKNIQTPPDLQLFEKGQTIYFPLMQLLWGLSQYNLKPGTQVKTVNYRDIPCNLWLHRLNYTSDDGINYVVDVEAYWSNGKWNSSSKENVVPVGFIIYHDGLNKTSGERVKTEQHVNVMYFTKDYFNKEAFLPRQGVYCPGRKSIKPFPSLGDLTGVSANVDFQWKDYKVDSNVDIRIDTTTKIVQVRYDPTSQGPNVMNRRSRISSTLIASYEESTAYDIRGDSCKVMWINEIVDDVQMLYDVKELSQLTTDHFLGRDVKYVYIGETVKRGIPCHLWQGERRGWPNDEPSITTVWEWCIAERRVNPFMPQDVYTIPIISLDITVTESHLTVAAGTYALGTKLSYDFYHLVAREPSYLKLLDFDISPCFNDSYKEWLQFKVDAESKQKIIKNATANADFVELWRSTIYGATGIRPASLRVAKVKPILAGNVLIVQFILLERHPDTPAFVVKDANLAEAKSNLNLTINDGLSVDWQNDVLRAQKGSLGPVFEFIKPTETVVTTSSLSPAPTDSVRSSETASESLSTKRTVNPTKEVATTSKERESSSLPTGSTAAVTDALEAQRSTEKRHSPGTMAGLGISMLILGFSLGAGGTFAKFRYFPNLW